MDTPLEADALRVPTDPLLLKLKHHPTIPVFPTTRAPLNPGYTLTHSNAP